jgi:hypothetical protein
MKNRRADWLIEDLEQDRKVYRDLNAEAERAGDHRLALAYMHKADAYERAIALVADALPHIIEEAQRVEPNRAIVFGPLASHAMEDAAHAAALADMAARAETA